MLVARERSKGQVEVCLVSSHGGHLELLAMLAPTYRERSHLLVTPPGPQAEALAKGGLRTAPIVNPHRSPLLLVRNAAQAAGLLRRARPRVVVSSGAGTAAPLCLLAKAAGARLIFIETMARIQDGSATGRLLERFADHFLVQWPELTAVYRRAEVCRPQLLEAIGRPSGAGRGTFVATGTHSQPFDRLLRWADAAADAGALPGPVLAQAGPSGYAARHMKTVSFLSPAAVEGSVASSEVVVCHGGSGLVSAALRRGRRPLVMARRAAHGEHVDDHQVAVTRKLASMRLAVDVDGAVDPAKAVAASRGVPEPPTHGVGGPPLADRLAELIEGALGR